MFTGLIRDIGEIESHINNILKVKSKLRPEIGDSIAINGVCLTVISKSDTTFSVELSTETRDIVDISRFKGQSPPRTGNGGLDDYDFDGHTLSTGHYTTPLYGTIKRV